MSPPTHRDSFKMKENISIMEMMKRVLTRKMMKTLKMRMTTTRRLRKTTYKMTITMVNKTKKMMSMIMSAKMMGKSVKTMQLSNQAWSRGAIKTFTMELMMRMSKKVIALLTNFLNLIR